MLLSFSRWPVQAVALAMLWGCHSEASAPAADAKALLEAAIRAHGGRERFAALDNVKIIGTGRFKDRLATKGAIYFSAPDTWAVDVEALGGTSMRFGIDAGRCWRKDRHFVQPCSNEDKEIFRHIGDQLEARLLHGLDGRPFIVEANVTLGGEAAPALRSADIVYVFDPKSSLLTQMRWGDHVETFADFRPVAGVLVPARRTMTIGGQPDVEENWEQILPGGANEKELQAPAPPREGDAIDEVDSERSVVWTEVTDLDEGAARAVSALEAFARSNGQDVSSSDGLVFTALHDDGAPPDGQRWRLALTLEPGRPRPPAKEGPFQFETWPAMRVVGAFHRGVPRAETDARDAARRWMESRRLVAVPGARWQVVRLRESPGHPSLRLLRVAVEQADQ